MNDKLDLTEKTISSKNVYDGVLLHVLRDEVLLPDGKNAIREMIVHNGAVCVVPIDENDNVYLVRQYRYPFGTTMLEIPAGKIDKGESPIDAARRELEEEIGMVADSLVHIGDFYPTVAYSTENIHMYVARGLRKTTQRLDDDEFLNIEIMSMQALKEDIMQGKVCDGKTIAAVLKALAM